MKLLTLNTHSLAEENYESKLQTFAAGLIKEMPDVIALQEVNQTQTALPVDDEELNSCGYLPCGSASQDNPPGPQAVHSPVPRIDNHAFRLAKILAEQELPYHWTWIAAKTGYGIYDEGLALFSRLPILNTEQFYITESQDYSNWKTRNILGAGISTEYGTEYVYSVHLGWWDDAEEPFKEQWRRICRGISHTEGDPVWLMGDFNSPAHVKGEGRDLILESGWFDSYDLAACKDEGITVSHAIDGWKERGELPGMRIDYIWTNRTRRIKSSRTIFNGTHHPIVSDHFGIILEY